MNCDTLDAVANLIQGDPVFKKGQRVPTQLPVKHQLMIFKHFIGREGETNLNQRSVFHVSEGCCKKAHDRVVQALTNLRDEYICWPDADERKQISRRIEEKYHLPNCVCMMDGTLLELGISDEVIPPFKSSPGMGLLQTPDKQLFNLCLASPHVTAGHTMGL